MRILSITAQKPDSTGSGVYLTELVKGFHELGQEQAVVCGVLGEDAITLPEDVVRYPYYYETERLPFSVLGMSDEMPYRSTRYCDMTEAMTKKLKILLTEHLEKVVETFQPDVILCHHLYYITSLVRELFPKHKVYGVCHGSDLRQMKKNLWQLEYIRTQIAKLDGILALHKEQKADIVTTYGCKEKNVTVIGTGYNKAVFYKMSSESKKNKKIRLIFAGKISEKKGVMSMLRALSYIENANEKYELAIAGGAGNQEEYEQICLLAEKCPCKVEFLGRLSHQELAREMNRSDVFVLPSFFEGLPLVVIEAMACGLRVVCTDLPGIRPWLEEKLPTHSVLFVEPPQMKNADEPIEEKLPQFEKELAAGIESVMARSLPKQEELEELSWDGLCQACMQMFQRDIMDKE